ncbi:nitroreductase [Cohnella sp. CFH 77786]|uniref:nitroreductase family protein n=1 Tax=Cohnella sp. CFH 77786 TaxID=2662265 RepID=UPI001C60C81C|nr:nitroreductase [Cohnella sp. CFH 77786]MBW5444728.1 nitroreductase [Cohnella sp. CFH 77786]
MNVEEAIRSRRSIGKVKEDPVPRRLVERIIEAAVWAPNHHRTEPWRFVVMTGEGRRRLGRAYAEIASESWGELSEEERQERARKEEAKAFRAPVVIAAVCSPSDSPKAVLNEERAAVHAAVQNLLLAAHANGLGAVWRTGDPAYRPEMKRALGLEDLDEVAGLIYVGYPGMEAPEGRRTPGAGKTVWLED